MDGGFSIGSKTLDQGWILPCGVFQIYKFSLLYSKLKKVMTFFLGMNYKFSLYIFQLFPKSPPIQGKFDLKHQFTSIFTKNFPHLPSGFPDFPLIKTLRNDMTFFFREKLY